MVNKFSFFFFFFSDIPNYAHRSLWIWNMINTFSFFLFPLPRCTKLCQQKPLDLKDDNTEKHCPVTVNPWHMKKAFKVLNELRRYCSWKVQYSVLELPYLFIILNAISIYALQLETKLNFIICCWHFIFEYYSVITRFNHDINNSLSYFLMNMIRKVMLSKMISHLSFCCKLNIEIGFLNGPGTTLFQE